MRLSLRSLLALPLAFGAVAAPSVTAAAAQPSGEVAGADSTEAQGRLTGRWSATVRVDSARGLGDDVSRQASGEMAFRPAAPLAGGIPPDRAVQPGTFDIPFGELGIELATQSALGWVTSDGSVRITLHPAVGAGAVEMQGTLAQGGTIAGRWSWRSGARSASGTFVMRR